MRIGIVAPPFVRVPPLRYGGTERVVAALTDELVARGHDVTLFASGDSVTRAELVATVETGTWRDDRYKDDEAARTRAIGIALRVAEERELDVLGEHIGWQAFPALRRSTRPAVHTAHWRLDEPDQALVYDEFRDIPMVSISDAQRRPLPDQSWIATIHHGIPRDQLTFGAGRGGYLVYCGRIAPEKGVHRAIDVAKRVGMRIVLAAPIPSPRFVKEAFDYYEAMVKDRLREPHVEFVGECDDEAKQQLLGDAAAFVFPIAWPEPFGLALIESVACGTPVVATPRGSLPEIVVEGRSGALGESDGELAAAVERALSLDRAAVRASFEHRFTSDVMAAKYERVYQRVIALHQETSPVAEVALD